MPKHGPKGPARIWLQVGEDDNGGYPPDPAPDDVTWCDDRIFATDIEYVRIDLAKNKPTKVTLPSSQWEDSDAT